MNPRKNHEDGNLENWNTRHPTLLVDDDFIDDGTAGLPIPWLNIKMARRWASLR